MQIKELRQVPRKALEQLLLAVPFYKTVRQQSEAQFDLLLQHSRLVICQPGDEVLRQGESDHWLFFLLKGSLDVTVDAPTGSQAVNQITPGEVFGDLAMLMGRRTATISVSHTCREAMVFGTSFKVFGPLAQCYPVTMATKLAYYRNMVHSLRWKLEVYRNQYPQADLASRHRQVKLYSGAKDCLEELQELYRQAMELSELLIAWNRSFGSVSSPVEPPDQKLLEAIG